jgi:hypothetical protein
MGLSPNYVYKMLNLLRGYGHIDDNGMTELGKQSLIHEKKIIKVQERQMFQLDALNGNLIKINDTISENVLSDKEHTSYVIGHLNYIDGISVDAINSQLKSQNFCDFIRQRKGILNTNVLAVNDVKCLEIKYAKCKMIKFHDFNESVIFAKRYDPNKKQLSERFTWQPFSVSSKEIKQKYGFEDDIPISSELAVQYIRNVYTELIDRSAKVKPDEIQNAIKRVYPFNWIGVSFDALSQAGRVILNISEDAFDKYNSRILDFLLDIQRDGECLVTNEYLYGKLISLRTLSKRVAEVANICSAVVDSVGKQKVNEKLKDSLKEFEGDMNDNVLERVAVISVEMNK